MKTVIRIYDKSLMFRAENISCEFLEERLNIFCPNLTKEKMTELKIKNFKKNETDILKFLSYLQVLEESFLDFEVLKKLLLPKLMKVYLFP